MSLFATNDELFAKLRAGNPGFDVIVPGSEFVERMIKANWGGKSFVTSYVKGAAAFDEDKAKDISGIKTDDASGQITITLDTPWGPIELAGKGATESTLETCGT